ncbi:MAG: hypothetical protein JWR35_212 [Marmoricola sp.]|nr:hypothetical protein [Marmoricola sp.]
MTQPADAEVINLLVKRDGIPTLVTLKNGLGLTVRNIAWGYDIGDEFAHVTTNISPAVDGASIDTFFTNDIESISDPTSGEAFA